MRELVVLNESPEVAIALRYASVGLWMVVAAQAFGALCSNQSKRRTRDEEDAFDTDFVRSEEYTEGYSDRVPRNVNRKGQSWDCMKITSIAPTIVFVVACSLLAVHTMQFQEAVPSTASGDEMRGAIVVRAIPLIDAARSRDADLTRCPATLNRLQLYAISVRLRSCDSRLPAVGKRGVPIKRGQAMTNQNIYLFFSFGFLLAAYVETGRGGTRALLIELSLEIVLWFLICCLTAGACYKETKTTGLVRAFYAVPVVVVNGAILWFGGERGACLVRVREVQIAFSELVLYAVLSVLNVVAGCFD